MTKCGRYGSYKENFDYSPEIIRRSVERSLARLHTTYLDVVYLHDVEFIADAVLARPSGDHTSALTAEGKEYGLAEEQMGKIWGEGDRAFLGAVTELRNMQAEGLIKHIESQVSAFVHFLSALYQFIRACLFRLPTPNAPSALPTGPPHPSLQTTGHPPLVLAI